MAEAKHLNEIHLKGFTHGFRMRYITARPLKMLEAAIVSAVTATTGFLMFYLMNDCKPYGNGPTKNPIQMYCDDGEYNVIGAIWFQTPEQSVRSLFHDPPGSHHLATLGKYIQNIHSTCV